MAAKGTVVVNIVGDHSKFDQSLDHVGRGVGKLGSIFQGVGLAIGAAMTAAAVKVGQALTDSVQKAADFGETLSKSNTIFKEQASVVEAWAEGAARNFGQSKGAALDAASSFGNMFRQLGIGGEEAAKMSMGITELASDFASFHNADISEVITAQSAAFRGEYDSLQRFLPLINAATVEQRAMEMTGKANADALTAQEKALAVNALMYEGAGDALGDFDRTADSAANKQRTLGALWEDMQVKIGQKLLPVFSVLLGFLVDKLLPGFDKVTKVISEGWKIITQVLRTGGTENELRDGLPGFFERVGLAALAIKEFVLNELIPALQRIWVDVQPALTQFRDILAQAFTWLSENLPGIIQGIRDFLEPVIAWLVEEAGPTFMELYQTVRSAFEAMVAIISTVVKIIMDLWNRFGEQLVGRLVGFLSNIMDVVRGLMNVLGGIFDLIKAILTGKWGEAWDAILRILTGFRDAITGALRAFWDMIAGLFEVFKGVVSAAWSALWNMIWTAVTDIFGGVYNWLRDRINDVVGWFQDIPSRLSGAFRGAFDGLKNAFRSAVNFIIDGWNGLSFTMPSMDLGPLGKVGGWTISTPNIPRLASGHVARDPMLAIVGDTPGRTAEIITPESLMRQVVREETGADRSVGINIGQIFLGHGGVDELVEELDWMVRTF